MTFLVHLFHLLFLLSNPLCQAEEAASTWLPVRVDETWVTQDGTKFGQQNTMSDITCAALANQANWSNLFCFQEGICRFNDVIVPPFFEETQPGNIIDCKARKQDPDDSSQDTDDSNQGSLVSTCPAPYQRVTNVGCIMIIATLYNYDDAVTQCQQAGGEPVTPESFTALVEYLETEVEGSANAQYWVGAQVSTGWHDGRAVEASELIPGEPDGTGDCYRMRGSWNFLLGDNGCNFEYYVICER